MHTLLNMCGSTLLTIMYYPAAVVQELFSPFGPISRVYIAYDRDTGENRGFAFVNFVYRYIGSVLCYVCQSNFLEPAVLLPCKAS